MAAALLRRRITSTATTTIPSILGVAAEAEDGTVAQVVDEEVSGRAGAVRTEADAARRRGSAIALGGETAGDESGAVVGTVSAVIASEIGAVTLAATLVSAIEAAAGESKALLETMTGGTT